MSAMSLTAGAIKARARALGFDLCGVARAEAYPELAWFAEWLARGYAGGMQYLVRTAHRRADVRHVLPSARSVIVLGTNYHIDRPYSVEISDPGEAFIARYARGDDYHAVLGRRVDALLAWMREANGEPFEARAYTDTGPVQERIYAQRAGLGWIGKNTCLISPDLGSWIFLSEILCSLDLDADEPGLDRCGACTLCLEACPTGAIVEPRVLDATRCLSYLTIELRGEMPGPWRDRIGTHVFGCDICQEVCPWNQSPPVSRDPAWQPRPALDRPRLAALASLDDGELARIIEGTALTRAGVVGLRRNLRAALAAVGHDAGGEPPAAGRPAGDGVGSA
jgi:epoxyqueuosine reductase